ncbi:MAG: hypothetical protein ACI90V_008439, partial [Bacillariaceae sp.]|jgi:hypothetical protein
VTSRKQWSGTFIDRITGAKKHVILASISIDRSLSSPKSSFKFQVSKNALPLPATKNEKNTEAQIIVKVETAPQHHDTILLYSYSSSKPTATTSPNPTTA